MSIQQQRFLEGFVKTCKDYGIYEEGEIFQLLKEALAPPSVRGQKAADKNDDSYYEQAGKKVGKDTKVKPVDEYGLSGQPGRTNVSDGPDYEM